MSETKRIYRVYNPEYGNPKKLAIASTEAVVSEKRVKIAMNQAFGYARVLSRDVVCFTAEEAIFCYLNKRRAERERLRAQLDSTDRAIALAEALDPTKVEEL